MYALPALAVNPATWTASLSTTGTDVFWTSPTAVDTGFPRYDWSYEITRVEAFTFLGGTDLTDSLGEDASGSGISMGLPVLFFNDTLVEETTNSRGTVRLEIDSQGFGRFSATDVTLGSLFFLQIRRVEFDAIVTVEGVPGPPGDYDNNGMVDMADYALWRQAIGTVGSQAADGNGDGEVNSADYTIWRDNVGATIFPPSGTALPEPPVATSLLSPQRLRTAPR